MREKVISPLFSVLGEENITRMAHKLFFGEVNVCEMVVDPLTMTEEADDYVGACGQAPGLSHWGVVYACIPVLEFLNGQPWDALALNYVHALRPSMIRVIRHGCCEASDSWMWRVTVYLEADDRTIYRMEQEVVAEARGVQTGYDLRLALNARIA